MLIRSSKKGGHHDGAREFHHRQCPPRLFGLVGFVRGHQLLEKKLAPFGCPHPLHDSPDRGNAGLNSCRCAVGSPQRNDSLPSVMPSCSPGPCFLGFLHLFQGHIGIALGASKRQPVAFRSDGHFLFENFNYLHTCSNVYTKEWDIFRVFSSIHSK